MPGLRFLYWAGGQGGDKREKEKCVTDMDIS